GPWPIAGRLGRIQRKVVLGRARFVVDGHALADPDVRAIDAVDEMIATAMRYPAHVERIVDVAMVRAVEESDLAGGRDGSRAYPPQTPKDLCLAGKDHERGNQAEKAEIGALGRTHAVGALEQARHGSTTFVLIQSPRMLP